MQNLLKVTSNLPLLVIFQNQFGISLELKLVCVFLSRDFCCVYFNECDHYISLLHITESVISYASKRTVSVLYEL